MSKKEIIERVKFHLEPILKNNNCELFDIIFVKEAKDWYLRIFIDKLEGVTINDCEIVSKSIEIPLDEEDFIEHSYILEVCSPGIDRPIRNKEDFERFKGSLIDIKLYKALNKKKEYQGHIIDYTNEVITIEEDGKEISFNKKNIATCRLAVIF